MLALARERLAADFRRIRAKSHALCAPLRPQEWRVQSMPDVSPPWWNMGHTSWFFARNVLHEFGGYDDEFAHFEYALNSYYEGLGPHLPRTQRGSVTRPSTDEVLAYRGRVDERMLTLLASADPSAWHRLAELTTIGLQHEQQHQELLLTEILHNRYCDVAEFQLAYCDAPPLRPSVAPLRSALSPALSFVSISGGIVEIGHHGDAFAWDNELPRHRAFVDDFALANRLVTCDEWLMFMAEGGYRNALLWLSNGWSAVLENAWQAPHYWERRGDAWQQWTLRGWRPVEPHAPVCHVSFYEADAFARWSGARLPTEREWEHAASVAGFDAEAGNLLDDGRMLTRPALHDVTGLQHLAGDVWEWTSSHYEPYPGYRPFDGALMEYNGKFMDNQRVLRGGSFATPREHIRASYRNFWPADTRFQCTGLRLAR